MGPAKSNEPAAPLQKIRWGPKLGCLGRGVYTNYTSESMKAPVLDGTASLPCGLLWIGLLCEMFSFQQWAELNYIS